MRVMAKNSILKIATILFFITSCGGEKTSEINDVDGLNTTLKVFTVNYPLYYFAKRIGGKYVDLIYPIPANEDPAYWEPQNALSEIQKADLILTNGAGYAKWKKKVSLPSSKIVNTSKSFRDKYIELKAGPTHNHGGEGEHSHKESAFTTWLDFKLAIEQATAVKDALVKLRPEQKNNFEQNFSLLKTELKAIDFKMESLSNKFEKENMIGSHPVYQYLALGYGLNIRSVHWEPRDKPSNEQWLDLEEKIKDHQVKIMLWEAAPIDATRERLQKMNIEIVVFSPCANTPAVADFITVMKENISEMESLDINI